MCFPQHNATLQIAQAQSVRIGTFLEPHRAHLPRVDLTG